MADRYDITKTLRVRNSLANNENGYDVVHIGADAINVDVDLGKDGTQNLQSYLEQLIKELYVTYWIDVDE